MESLDEQNIQQSNPSKHKNFVVGIILLVIIIAIIITITVIIQKSKKNKSQDSTTPNPVLPEESSDSDTLKNIGTDNTNTTQTVEEALSPDILKRNLESLQQELSDMNENIKAENVKDFSVSKLKKDVDAALIIIEKNHDKWTPELNTKIEKIVSKYNTIMPETRLDYEKSLRHAKLINGTLVDIISNDLTYEEAKEYFFIENGDLIAYSYTDSDGTVHQVPVKQIPNYTDYWQRVPDLYFYLYRDVQPNLTWRSQESPTKSKILSQRNDDNVSSADRKIYKKIYDNLELSLTEANNAYLDLYTDVKRAHENPDNWLSKNDGGDVHYYGWGYSERRVWPTPFNLPTKDQLVAKYTDDQFNPQTTSIIDNFNPPTEQYFPMKRYKQTYQHVGYLYDFY